MTDLDWLDKLSLICGFISFAAFVALVAWNRARSEG